MWPAARRRVRSVGGLSERPALAGAEKEFFSAQKKNSATRDFAQRFCPIIRGYSHLQSKQSVKSSDWVRLGQTASDCFRLLQTASDWSRLEQTRADCGTPDHQVYAEGLTLERPKCIRSGRIILDDLASHRSRVRKWAWTRRRGSLTKVLLRLFPGGVVQVLPSIQMNNAGESGKRPRPPRLGVIVDTGIRKIRTGRSSLG